MVFELYDLMATKSTSDFLGMWTVTPVMRTDTTAFAIPLPTTDASVWRVKLPADMRRAASYLTKGERSLGTSHAALPTVATRIQAVVERQASGFAFTVPPVGRALALPEAELWSWLHEVQAGKLPVSFGLGEKILGGWPQVARQFNEWGDRLLRAIAHYAWVETYIEELLVGQTAVSWTGDLDTVWHADLSSAQVALHQRALALGLASRNTLMQTLIVAVQSALTLSAVLTSPGGALLALPLAWQFIHQVFAEHHQ